MAFTILFVDDEPHVLDGLSRILRHRRKEWRTFFARNVDDALEIVFGKNPDVVVSDISMPKKTGFDLLSAIRQSPHHNDLPFLMLTGLNDRDLKRKALDLGATDLLSKPADPEELVARIGNMLRLKSQQDEIKQQNADLDQKVRERTVALEYARLDLIWRLARAAEFRDNDTGHHIIRVSYYCKILAEAVGLDKGFVESIFITSPLHDIGKIGIPDHILLKPGKLLPDEWTIMKKHSEIGAQILKQDAISFTLETAYHDMFGLPGEKKTDINPLLEMAGTIALGHHERCDGAGYPAGLSGDAIPLAARITAIADVYDALSSRRPYKPAYPPEKVLHIMRDNRHQFDPDLFNTFIKSAALFADIRHLYTDNPQG